MADSSSQHWLPLSSSSPCTFSGQVSKSLMTFSTAMRRDARVKNGIACATLVYNSPRGTLNFTRLYLKSLPDYYKQTYIISITGRLPFISCGINDGIERCKLHACQSIGQSAITHLSWATNCNLKGGVSAMFQHA